MPVGSARRCQGFGPTAFLALRARQIAILPARAPRSKLSTVHTTRAKVLTDCLPLPATVVRDIALVIAGSLVVALMAQLAVWLPFSPVPVTLQTLAVLLVGATLGCKRGGAALLLYASQAAVGLPVLAGGLGGPAALLGPSGGYVFGFVVAATVVGYLCERKLDRSVRSSVVPFAVGSMIVLSCGATWLSLWTGAPSIASAWNVGVLPFLPGEAVKVVVAALALPAAWHFMGGSSKQD